MTLTDEQRIALHHLAAAGPVPVDEFTVNGPRLVAAGYAIIRRNQYVITTAGLDALDPSLAGCWSAFLIPPGPRHVLKALGRVRGPYWVAAGLCVAATAAELWWARLPAVLLAVAAVGITAAFAVKGGKS